MSLITTNLMAKCSICKEKIQELFLGKLKGTIIRKPSKSKQYEVCNLCQKKFSKEELLGKL